MSVKVSIEFPREALERKRAEVQARGGNFETEMAEYLSANGFPTLAVELLDDVSFRRRVAQAAKCDLSVLRADHIAPLIEAQQFDKAVEACIAHNQYLNACYRRDLDTKQREYIRQVQPRMTPGRDRQREDDYLMTDAMTPFE